MRILLLALLLTIYAITPKLAWAVELGESSNEVFEAKLDYSKSIS